jgi:hypothetical protein
VRAPLRSGQVRFAVPRHLQKLRPSSPAADAITISLSNRSLLDEAFGTFHVGDNGRQEFERRVSDRRKRRVPMALRVSSSNTVEASLCLGHPTNHLNILLLPPVFSDHSYVS